MDKPASVLAKRVSVPPYSGCECRITSPGRTKARIYLIHTPFAFKPGDDQDPRDEKGDVIYDEDTTLLDTWRGMEELVDGGRCRAIGLSDVDLGKLMHVYEAARIKPAVIQVEAHPYLPETELLRFCREKSIVLLAFAPLGHGMKPGPIEDPVVLSIAEHTGRTPAQVLLAWAAQRGSALLTTPKSAARATENFDVTRLIGKPRKGIIFCRSH